MTTTTATPSADLRSHFTLTALPFTREIALDQRWRSPIFDEPLGYLETAVNQRMSAALIAPAGAGKTAVLRTLRSRLPEARYHLRYLKVTSLSKRDLCREIAATLGLEPAGTYHRLVRLLQEHLESVSSADGRRPVLLLDESHDMRPEVLAILRILTNFDMDSRLVLAVVLAGQPSLARLLERPDLAAIRSRLAHVATLRLARRMFARWSQENFFRYMRHEFDLDHLPSHRVEPADPERSVPNPAIKEKKNSSNSFALSSPRHNAPTARRHSPTPSASAPP